MQFLANKRLWPVWVLLLSLLILVPRLGSYGFWEPQEMEVASRALPLSEEEKAEKEAKEEADRKRDRARLEQEAKNAGKPPPTEDEIAEATEKRKAAQNAQNRRPPLVDAMVERGIGLFGVSEFGARIPFAFLAMLAALATFFLGQRIRSARAGLLGAIILLACPLFLFQSRQLTSELGAIAGGAFFLLGAIGIASPPKSGRSPLLYTLDCVALVLGSALGYYSSGFFVGFIAPMAAVAVAAQVSAFLDRPAASESRRASLHLQIAAGTSTLLLMGAGLYFTLDVFDWTEATDSEFSIGGMMFHSDGKYHDLLAGAWKQEGTLKHNFNSLFEQIAFGLFPWIALAPIAVTRMASGGDSKTNPLGARMLFAWAAIAWLICTVVLRKVGPVQYPAIPAIAVGIAVWLDGLLDARASAATSAEGEEASPELIAKLAPPLVALFVLFAVVVLAKDIKSFPATLMQMHIDGANLKFPDGIGLHKVLMGLGIVFGLSLAAWLYLWRPARAESQDESMLQRAVRLSLPATLGMSLLISIFLSQAWTPKLATKLSSRATFSAFRELYEPGNKLGIVGQATDGAKFYAGAPFETLSGRGGLISFLKEPERVFALVKASELCPIHKESTNQGFDYYVVDDTNADKIILSNRMWNGEAPPPPALHAAMRDVLDRNPLSRYILRERPENISRPLDINFDDKLQLIGVDMPESATRGSTFTMRLYYEVLKPIRKGYQVFVHFDGAGVRFQGDHWPVKKRCGTNYWQPGAFIVDEFTVEAGSSTHATTSYQVWTGLFVGSAGNWENMKAVTGSPDDNNRVKIGTLRLK